MRDIPEERRLTRFPRVAMPGIHADVLEVRAESQTWEEFDGRLLEKYGLDDALQLSKRDFMEWVETPEKGRNAIMKKTVPRRKLCITHKNRPLHVGAHFIV